MIEVTLKKECIQTALKKEYEKLIGSYFKDKNLQTEIVEQKIEAIKNILENADFQKLRTSHKELNGSQKEDIYVFFSSQNPFNNPCNLQTNDIEKIFSIYRKD